MHISAIGNLRNGTSMEASELEWIDEIISSVEGDDRSGHRQILVNSVIHSSHQSTSSNVQYAQPSTVTHLSSQAGTVNVQIVPSSNAVQQAPVQLLQQQHTQLLPNRTNFPHTGLIQGVNGQIFLKPLPNGSPHITLVQQPNKSPIPISSPHVASSSSSPHVSRSLTLLQQSQQYGGLTQSVNLLQVQGIRSQSQQQIIRNVPINKQISSFGNFQNQQIIQSQGQIQSSGQVLHGQSHNQGQNFVNTPSTALQNPNVVNVNMAHALCSNQFQSQHGQSIQGTLIQTAVGKHIIVPSTQLPSSNQIQIQNVPQMAIQSQINVIPTSSNTGTTKLVQIGQVVENSAATLCGIRYIKNTTRTSSKQDPKVQQAVTHFIGLNSQGQQILFQRTQTPGQHIVLRQETPQNVLQIPQQQTPQSTQILPHTSQTTQQILLPQVQRLVTGTGQQQVKVVAQDNIQTRNLPMKININGQNVIVPGKIQQLIQRQQQQQQSQQIPKIISSSSENLLQNGQSSTSTPASSSSQSSRSITPQPVNVTISSSPVASVYSSQDLNANSQVATFLLSAVSASTANMTPVTTTVSQTKQVISQVTISNNSPKMCQTIPSVASNAGSTVSTQKLFKSAVTITPKLPAATIQLSPPAQQQINTKQVEIRKLQSVKDLADQQKQELLQYQEIQKQKITKGQIKLQAIPAQPQIQQPVSIPASNAVTSFIGQPALSIPQSGQMIIQQQSSSSNPSISHSPSPVVRIVQSQMSSGLPAQGLVSNEMSFTTTCPTKSIQSKNGSIMSVSTTGNKSVKQQPVIVNQSQSSGIHSQSVIYHPPGQVLVQSQQGSVLVQGQQGSLVVQSKQEPVTVQEQSGAQRIAAQSNTSTAQLGAASVVTLTNVLPQAMQGKVPISASAQVAVPTQIKIANHILTLNLTQEQKDKVQGYLTKMTPVQQQQQMALILKLQELNAQVQSQLQQHKKLQAQNVPSQIPLPVQQTIANHILTLNLTQEKKDKVQGYLAKMTPVQQQQQMALILKLHELNAQVQSQLQQHKKLQAQNVPSQIPLPVQQTPTQGNPDECEFTSDSENIENNSTGRPPPNINASANGKVGKDTDNKHTRTSWLKNIRNEGDKTLFGKSGIRIEGFQPDSDGSALSEGTIEKWFNSQQGKAVKQGSDKGNESSESTECESITDTSIKPFKSCKLIKNRIYPHSNRIALSDSDTDQSDNDNEQSVMKPKGHKPVTPTKEPIYLLSSDTTETDEVGKIVPSIGGEQEKRKRPLSVSKELCSTSSTNKKLKHDSEESTEESSDSRWMFGKKGKLGNCSCLHEQPSRRKSSEREDSSLGSDNKQETGLAVPQLSLKFCASDEDSDETVTEKPINIKPLLRETISEHLSDLSPDDDLPQLTRPRKKSYSSNSEFSSLSGCSNASTVAYQNSEVEVKTEKDQSSYPIEDPEYLLEKDDIESESNLDVPLHEIMRKRCSPHVETQSSKKSDLDNKGSISVIKKEGMTISVWSDTSSTEEEKIEIDSSDSRDSELLLTQDEEDVVKTEEKKPSYTVEEDCIFIDDSDDDLYSSMSQQNLTIDFENPPENENDENHLARFFLGDQDEEPNFDIKIKPESPELAFDFDWLKQTKRSNKLQPEIEEKFEMQTQVNSSVKLEKIDNEAYDADTQIICCDDFSDSDEGLFDAETQLPNSENNLNVKTEPNSDNLDTQDYYNMPTQPFLNVVEQNKEKDRRFEMDQTDDDSVYGQATQAKKYYNKKVNVSKLTDIKNVNEAEKSRKINRFDEAETRPPSKEDINDSGIEVNRTRKHSIVRRVSDEGPCTIEHTKIETVKVTKQFTSPDEAHKYLQRVRSSTENLLVADNETQEYEWVDEKTTKLNKRSSLNEFMNRDRKVAEANHGDVYDIMTQISMDNKTAKSETDLYAAQTQIDTDNLNEENSKERVGKMEWDPYLAQTHVGDVIEINDDDDDDLYMAATQVDADKNKWEKIENGSSSSGKPSISNSCLGEGPQKISSNVCFGVPKNVFDAMTQMECRHKTPGELSDLYNADTQVVRDSKHDSDEELYYEATQVVSDRNKHDSDDDCYHAATQAVIDSKQDSDQELWDAATQVERKDKSRKHDVYNNQTLVDNIEEETNDDCYSAMTQCESNIIKTRNNESRNMFTTLTRIKGVVSDNRNEDPYNAQTQVHGDDQHSSGDEFHCEAPGVPEASDAEESDKSYDEYVCMLGEEDMEQKQEEKLENNYIIMLEDSPTETSPPSLSASKDKKTPRKEKTYERHTLLKKISSDEKKAKFIPAQKEKSLKEKRESFKLDKDKFYSKASTSKSDYKSTDNSDINIVDDEQWMSKKEKSKEEEKCVKRHTSRDFSARNDKTVDKIQEAKNRMAARAMEQAVHPRPVKRRHPSAEVRNDVSDVKLPDEKEIIAKGLPLLEYPQKELANSPDKKNKNKEQGEREEKYIKLDGERKRGEKSKSSSSERKSRDKHRSSSQSSSRSSHHNKHSKDSKYRKSSEKNRKSEEKQDETKKTKDNENQDQRSVNKSTDKTSIESREGHAKTKSSIRHSSKSRESSNSKKDTNSSKNNGKDEKSRDKENGDKTNSIMKRIPKLSDSAKLDKEKEIQSKSPLTSLDSQTSNEIMSLIGLSSNISNQLKNREGKETHKSNTVTDIKASEEASGIAMGNSEGVESIKVSMYKERDLEKLTSASEITNVENQPKSILRKPGALSKGRRVDFILPTYSQSAENQRLQGAVNGQRPNYYFPEGRLPILPYQNNPATPRQPQSSLNVVNNRAMNQQATGTYSRPILASNNMTSMVNQSGMINTGGRPVIDPRILPTYNSLQQQPGNQPPLLDRPRSIPVPIFRQGGSPNSDLSILDLNYFFVKILKWNANWFDEYEKHQKTPPPIEEAHPVKHLLESYNSYEDYFKTLLPHLILETWETCVKSWQENKARQRSVDIAFTRVDKPHEKLLSYTFTAKEGVPSSSLIGLEISVKTRFRQFKILPDKRSSIQVVSSLVSTVRHYYALAHVYKTTICDSILKPGILRVFHNHPSVKDEDLVDLDRYNTSQKKAICIASKISLEHPENNRICLIQGPPGTGKSHVIIGIVMTIFKKSNRQCHICLCAPSNAAVDELMKRLINERRRMEEHCKGSGFRLVRIGKPENMHSDVHKYTFNEVVKINQAEELKNKMKRHVNSSIVMEIERLRDRISALERELMGKTVQLQHLEAGNLKNEIGKLKKKKGEMESEIQSQYKNIRLTRDEEERVKRDVLLKSHVVCGTLNSFGNQFYMNILTRNDNQTRRSIFQCVIMDESSQATELDTLVPLQYGITKLIMVGDPEQLPPTVLSQQSSKRSYEQSLFERFYNHFRFEEVNPVLLLDTQYRMHQEIAHFPSKFVYSGKLKTDESVQDRCKKFDLKPYILFDMQEGQELATQPGNIINSTEAEFTIELCEFLIKRPNLEQKDIGIIAPYQQQKKIIKEGLVARNLEKVEVNTVDSFQGREKEVIILTCTRAKSSSGGIGFLANKKRMNVALTRAKTALYVVGDLSSLRNGDSAWRMLIEDAENRHVICKVKTDGKYGMVFNSCLVISARLGRQFVT